MRFVHPHSVSYRKCLFSALLIWVIAGVTTQTAIAQSLTDGSIYSRFGLGDRSSFFSSKSQGMGGGGVAFGSINYVNFANPASFGDMIFTRFSAGINYETVTESADNEDSSKLASGYLNAIQFAFPLKPNKFGFGLSFTPFTRVSYRVDSHGTIVSDPEDGTQEPFITSFRGNGGLHKLSAGLGYRIGNSLGIGASADFVFGIIEETQRTTFESIRFVDSHIVKSTRLSGLSATLGIRFSRPRLFGANDAFSVGATFSVPTTLSAHRVFTVGESEAVDTLKTNLKGNVDLPKSIGVGIAYQPNRHWTIVADIFFEEWSAFKSDLAFPGYAPGGAGAFDDRLRFSGGAEFFPSARDQFSGFFRAMTFRLGFYADRSYVSPEPSTKINSIGVTGGISVPTLIPGTRIDMNLDVGRRGTTDNGLIEDRYIRFGVSLNFGERWFIQRKLR